MYTSYRNIPYLKSLQSKNADFIIPEEWGTMEKDTTITSWKDYVHLLQNVHIISKTFLESLERSRKSIDQIIKDEFIDNKETSKVSGTYIFSSYCVSILFETNPDVLMMHVIDKKTNHLVMSAFRVESRHWEWTHELFNKLYPDTDTLTLAETFVYQVLSIELFKKNAELETVYVKPKSKKKDFGKKYVNKTDLPVTHLDCTWFTTFIRSEGFSVRGHFRLQNYKIDGKSIKKLKWIPPHEKNGYTRKARKITI